MLTITHTHEAGTIIEGTERGDGSAEVLKAQRWRWGRSIAAWYIPHSRDRLPNHYRINQSAAALREAGFEVATEIEETTRSTAEVEAAKIERQEQRAAALEAKAERKSQQADQAAARADAAGRALPAMGEPIKIGHHSETRHRNAIDRAHSTLGKAVAAGKEADHAAARAETAATTTAARYGVQTVANRIKKIEAEIRASERSLNGYTRNPGSPYREEVAPASGAHRERVTAQLKEQRDQLDYWQGIRAQQVEEGKATSYSREQIAKGDYVRYRYGWLEVVRVNAKSVTVKTDMGWTDRLDYPELLGHRSAAEVAEIRAAAAAQK